MGDQEMKNILLDVEEQVKKNTKILKDLRARNRRADIGKVIKYALIVFAALYAWQYLQPVYESIMQTTAQIGNLGDGAGDLLNSLGKISEMADKIPGF